ncbi:hypothetical protein SAMN05216331_1194 [Porphyromonadaceae bacterium KH3R12]|nr:hypothetical protein SAMN05216331_1194 [Porphyromonadaceae bacterium KH3R12]SFL36616.1 hypothetical protein SAMN05216357_12035 [Porphyromonadaceae bacterium KH3CP3RA]
MEAAKKTKITARPMPKRHREKVSKTWLAALAHKGTGKIEDMKAVLK